MALKIFNPARRIDYVLTDDRASSDPTVFVLRRLTWEEMQTIQALVPVGPVQQLKIERTLAAARNEERAPTDAEIAALEEIVPNWADIAPRFTQLHARVCEIGVDEVRGLLDESGSALTMPPRDFIRNARVEHLNELANEILRLSTMDEAERKN